MEVKAALKGYRVSPRKARLVVDQIRGKGVEDALNLLDLSPKRVGIPIAQAAALRASRTRSRRTRSETCGHRARQPRRRPDLRRRRSQHVAHPRRARRAARPGSRSAAATSTSFSRNGKDEFMGQKVHPYGFRVGTLYGWQSNWFAAAPLRGAAPRRREDARLHQEEALPRRHLEGRDRADGRQGRDQHPHRAPGHPDRQARRRSRRASQGAQGASRRARSSSTSRRSARRSSTPSSSRRTSRPSSSAASRSGAR